MKLVVNQQSIKTRFTLASSGLKQNLKQKNFIHLTHKCILLIVSFITWATMANAQPNNNSTTRTSPVDMATGLRSNGKIYVVVAVLVIILTGLFFYLIRLDRKISRLEKGEWKDT
jgi:CcmD family protein